MGILAFIILGLAAGVIARAIHPGASEPSGLLGTTALGVAGALVGGLIASALGLGVLGSFFSLGTWLVAVAGALLLITVFNALTTRRAGHPRGA